MCTSWFFVGLRPNAVSELMARLVAMADKSYSSLLSLQPKAIAIAMIQILFNHRLVPCLYLQGVSLPRGLVPWTNQALVLLAAECGFDTWSWRWSPWAYNCFRARHATLIASKKSWEGGAFCSTSQAPSGWRTNYPCLHPYGPCVSPRSRLQCALTGGSMISVDSPNQL